KICKSFSGLSAQRARTATKGACVDIEKTPGNGGKSKRKFMDSLAPEPKRLARRRAIPKRSVEPDSYTLYLEEQLEILYDALDAAKEGDFSVRAPVSGGDHITAQVARVFNGLVERN